MRKRSLFHQTTFPLPASRSPARTGSAAGRACRGQSVTSIGALRKPSASMDPTLRSPGQLDVHVMSGGKGESQSFASAFQALYRGRLRAVAGQPPPPPPTNTHSSCTLSVAPPNPSVAVVVRFRAWSLGCGAASTNWGRVLRHGVIPGVHRRSGGRKTCCTRSRTTSRAGSKGECACEP